MGAIPTPIVLHIVSGNRWHVVDLIFYGGAGVLLLVGLALFASGRRACRMDQSKGRVDERGRNLR